MALLLCVYLCFLWCGCLCLFLFRCLLVREQTHILCAFFFLAIVWEVCSLFNSYIYVGIIKFYGLFYEVWWNIFKFMGAYCVSHWTPVAFFENILRFIKWNVRFYVDFFSGVFMFYFWYCVCVWVVVYRIFCLVYAETNSNFIIW